MCERIGKKEYLGKNELREFIVPFGVKEIGDWAFAQCAALERLAIPETVETLGKGVFDGCDALRQVYVYRQEAFDFFSCEKRQAVLAELCACALRFFQTAFLADFATTGTEAWLEAWDEACIAYLRAADDLGFAPFLAGGEEDYAEQLYSRTHYENARRKEKAQIALLRLRSEESFCLAPAHKVQYEDCLKRNPEAYAVLADQSAHIRETVEIFRTLGLFSGEKTEALIKELPADAVELRTLLMEDAGFVPVFTL